MEKPKEPCNAFLRSSSVSNPGQLGTGRKAVHEDEPDVYRQINYGIPFRLAKGFALLRQSQ